MDEHLSKHGVDADLASVLCCIASVVQEASALVRNASSEESGSQNKFGDKQLKVDVQVDDMIFERLRSCSAVEAASSEERPDIVAMSGRGYTVAFDPLDGSSIVGANFAVGSIFGVWPGGTMVGQTGRQQSAAAYAVYGPTTLLVWARPASGRGGPLEVEEFSLGSSGGWTLRRSGISIAPTRNVFAPANLRAASENAEYSKLVHSWIDQNFTLRYTGGMVPDVHHIIAKGGGVFCNPKSASAPPKLRLAYECAPLSFIMEAAGGLSHDGTGSLLDRVIGATSERCVVCLGSKLLVEQSIPALMDG
mmetsp:Transcript_24258/g.53024  ORF Transcript_24258/g.53024 Transcript_24258/m.53024 type:complete len:306 (+) Transcript_24258:97-1014(+)|eukprot:CAMPEP_0202921424 /NCGR_PEP_ID=MMETSP1392-20130828/77381_1 /ASSEMBLY_ACC=CAM_ASM_000868 /TAXON_ID=225041 /ORGANISM="Chlamydomonas chlamydogama, Strain SAG 11-48b" /LENGTH=305 /DNA_ID=CAMNT_0049614995 /DNA_START=49 /DNA_END=966 /DNA_ORIENTATION=-